MFHPPPTPMAVDISTDPSNWVPKETNVDMLNDRVYFVSIVLCAFGFGIVFTLYCLCARNLIAQIRSATNKGKAQFMLGYITLTTICGLVFFASVTRVAQFAFVDYRDYPDGPYAYRILTFTWAQNTVAIMAYFLVNWMADAMIIWRLYILYSSGKYARLIIAFPSLLYMGSLCASAVIIHKLSLKQSFWSAGTVPFGYAYFILTTTLTIVSNLCMTVRLLVARKQYMQAMGNTSHAKRYLSIVAMLVESSALFAVWSLIFVGLYATNHPLQGIFLLTLVDVAIIAMLLIMFRVSQDRAWKPDTESAFNGMEWRDASTIRGSSRYIKPSFQARGGSSTSRLENLVTVETFTVDDNKRRIETEP